ncbi:hypothetical protein MSG28_001292 [Choristoneura fumiferana]|uniref:Uncharacterized protein n=1 Tax=Choristoneura fumiferana TaxID=7141 RepID=A0ACC0K4S4_CHOFU|nr:hypothetical protein MSG28_001292 [Choristoneura fumiferana]
MPEYSGTDGLVEKLGRRNAVPVVYLKGSHYDIGFDTGRLFASVIKNFLVTYENLPDFEKEYATETGRGAYDKTLANMKNRYPQYVKEIQGIADGANVPFYKAVEERFASLCYAGQLPGYTMGHNENARTFITRALLAAKSFAEAEKILRDEGLGAANGKTESMRQDYKK